MSVFLKKNYYETLGVSPNASQGEIDLAYQKNRRLFTEGSDAVYSLYTEEEKRERLESLNAAYKTLSNQQKKREYDMTLGKVVHGDGTYEVDLGYIFGRKDKESSAAPEPVVRQGHYRQAHFIKTIAAMDRAEQVASEQFKLLSSRLEQANKKAGQKVMAFTSAIKGEGKSAVSLNTAYMLATAFGRSVVFVECDLRKPSSLQEQVAIEGPGLAEVLKGEASLDDAIFTLEDTGLSVISAGVFDRNTPDIIGSAATASFISSLRQRFEIVVLDCPPVIPLADMSIIEKLVDALVLVVRAGSTSRQLVTSAIEALDRKKFLGAVLNGAETKLEKYYY